MTVVCHTGEPHLDESAGIVIRRAAEGFCADASADRIRFVVLSSGYAGDFTPMPGDCIIRLYRGSVPPEPVMPGEHPLRRPFAIRELEAAVREFLLLRTAPGSRREAEENAPPGEHTVLREGEAPVFDGRTVTAHGVSAALTKREAALFAVLYANRGTPVSRETLTEAVWGRKTETNLCDVYVCRLRTRLEPVFGRGFLVGIRNEGYLMV